MLSDLCGSDASYANRVYDLGLFTGNFFSTSFNDVMMDVLDTTHIITDHLGLTMIGPNATSFHDFTNTDVMHLVQYNTHDAVAYRTLGAGKIIYLGFDFYLSNNDADRLIANSVSSRSPLSIPVP